MYHTLYHTLYHSVVHVLQFVKCGTKVWYMMMMTSLLDFYPARTMSRDAIGVITQEPIGSYEVPHSVALVAPVAPYIKVWYLS